MDDVVLASLVGWEELRALSGWVGLIGAVAMLAINEYMRRTFATKDSLELECNARKTADGHQDDRIHDLVDEVQQYIGKTDMIREQLEKADRARERETAELREEVRTGFARLEAALERRGNGKRKQGGGT